MFIAFNESLVSIDSSLKCEKEPEVLIDTEKCRQESEPVESLDRIETKLRVEIAGDDDGDY